MHINTFLMFEGVAEAAMNFYVALFPNSRVVSVDRYGAGEAGKEGSVRLAYFELAGSRYQCIDSPAKHAFTFTPSMSSFVHCDNTQQLDHLYGELLKDGQALMPADNYGFSQRFAWVQDRFGVSWQLNVA